MLTLTPGSACDVCAEEYSPHCQPHSIPCGHVLCASCCSTIVEKTPSRLTPVCPFCRENFTDDSVRIIRIEFNSSSGWNTSRRTATYFVESSQTDFASLWARRTERSSGVRPEARTLEEKVARVAAKKCSVEEVAALYRELDEWLKSDVSAQTSLLLSSALLRAILMNHQAHSEASRNIKIVEANLKAKIDELQLANEKIETELRKQRQQYVAKAQDYQNVCVELNKLKESLGSGGISTDARSPTTPTPPSTSPTPYTSASSQSPISRFNTIHHRSASMASRPNTPATPSPSRTYPSTPSSLLRTQTPAPLARTQTPAPLSRTQTPMARPYTPAPAHSLRSMTQTPSLMRTTTPAPPPIPTKPRRLSTPSTPAPQKMVRSPSEEKAELHQIWIPPGTPDPPLRAPSRSATRTPYITASSRFSPSATR